MAIKHLVVLTALPTDNEQTGVSPRTISTVGTTVYHETGDLSRMPKATFALDVTAIAGTSPTLDAVVKGFNPVSGKWHTVVTFPQQTTVTNATVPLATITADLPYTVYRAEGTLGGSASPSMTFALCAFAVSEEPAA